MDVKSAYFQGAPIDRDVWIRPPKGVGVPEGSLIKADKWAYGFTDGARKFFEFFTGIFKSLGALSSMVEPAFFYLKDASNKLLAMFSLHVDDVLATLSPHPIMKHGM